MEDDVPIVGRQSVRALRLALLLSLAAVLAPGGARAGTPAPYLPGKVVVGTKDRGSHVVALPPGETVPAGIARLRQGPGVAYAVPDYVAHMTATSTARRYTPNDRGMGRGWMRLQWNFLPGAGVDAPRAWANDRRARHPGGLGVRIAVLDTGAAYTTARGYKRSPDFTGTRFADGYDFVRRASGPLDIRTCRVTDNGRRHVIDGGFGHGTHVTGTIAEATNNRRGVTGLAYRATIIEIRVLDSCGYGDASTIAKGIRYAVRQHAKLINLSLEFPRIITAADIPDVLSALRYARRRGVLIVGASGNDGARSVSYPARSPDVLAVGATTDDRCLADYSNTGRVDVVAPGGGDDADLPGDPHCDLNHIGRPIYQETYYASTRTFGLPGDYEGTSMACPHVTATAALVIASRVIGANPSPAALTRRLEQTATDLGAPGYDSDYGYGLIDAGRATSR